MPEKGASMLLKSWSAQVKYGEITAQELDTHRWVPTDFIKLTFSSKFTWYPQTGQGLTEAHPGAVSQTRSASFCCHLNQNLGESMRDCYSLSVSK